jgi:hypothetical protein
MVLLSPFLRNRVSFGGRTAGLAAGKRRDAEGTAGQVPNDRGKPMRRVRHETDLSTE